MRLQDLEGHRVGILGFGREGRSALRAIRSHGLVLDLTVLDEHRPESHPATAPLQVGPLAELHLERYQVLIKSPGISLYRPEIQAAVAAGVRLASPTGMWFAEPRAAPVVAVSGTKGKSTTAALIDFLLRAARVNSVLAGNIGVPLLDLLQRPPADAYVVELSSYQTCDFEGRPEVAVLTNLFPEHLDWHRDLETYYRDKLKLFAGAPRAALVNAGDPQSVQRTAELQGRRLFNHARGWQVRGGQIFAAGTRYGSLPPWRLAGAHNQTNLAAALAAVEAVGASIDPGIEALPRFVPLPHRLEVVGEVAGVTLVDDSISTTPRSSVAALECFADRPTVIIVGGFDRGVDWQDFTDHLRRSELLRVVTTGAAGPRIAAAIRRDCPAQDLTEAPAFAEAVAQGLEAAPAGGVLLLSPGAPSFGEFRNFEERGRRFRELALSGS